MRTQRDRGDRGDSWKSRPECGIRGEPPGIALGHRGSVRQQSREERRDARAGCIRSLGKDPRIAAETARKVRQQAEVSSQSLRAELKTAEKELNRLQRELVKVAAAPGGSGVRTDRMADFQERIQTTERRVAEVRGELGILDAEAVSQPELKQALEAFDPVWKALNTGEQTRIVCALVERVGYDGRTGKIAVTFRSAGFKELCEMVNDEQ